MPDGGVVNASPVILLGKIGLLDLLEHLVAPILVPESVLRDLSVGLEGNLGVSQILNWATRRRAPDVSVPLSIERWDLGAGDRSLSH